MKRISIRTKVLMSLSVCLVAGVMGTLWLMHYSFERNSRMLATESVNRSQKLFAILEAREISKMTAVGDAMIVNPELRYLYQSQDRGRLMDFVAPIYTSLKEQGITNWIFHAPKPELNVFLRVHNPAKYGDHLNRFLTEEVAQRNEVVAGNELAKSGFAVRVIRPFYGEHGTVIGYIEMGEELGQFIHTMKNQTGDEYGLLLSKNFVDRGLWSDSCAAWKRRDNWDDHPGFVVADKTSDSEDIIRFDGDLTGIPEQGKVVERFQKGNSAFVRGVFPIRDAAGNTVGAMFVVRDISAFYLSMRHTQTTLVAMTIVALAFSTVCILLLLQRLVFRRLDAIIAVATRVVGGDYETEIQGNSDDEIGQFEKLFEQFRRVFVDVLSRVPELQEK